MSTRRYEQRARAEEAEKTRQRIIDAVFERLRAAPSEPVSVERIAEMAGVARSTVYAIFGSRAGLFDAVGEDLARAPRLRRLVEASHQPDAREALRGGLRAASAMLAGERDIWRALHSMAKLDEEAVGGAVARREQERAAAMARIARSLHEQGHLRAGVSAEEAATCCGCSRASRASTCSTPAAGCRSTRRRAADRDGRAGAYDAVAAGAPPCPCSRARTGWR